jgi:hypothetical protein
MIRHHLPTALLLLLAIAGPVAAEPIAPQFRTLPPGKIVSAPNNGAPPVRFAPNNTAMGGLPGSTMPLPALNPAYNPFAAGPAGSGVYPITAPPNATLGGRAPTAGSSYPAGAWPYFATQPYSTGGNGLGGYPTGVLPLSPPAYSPYAQPYNSFNDPRLNPYLYNPLLINPSFQPNLPGVVPGQ